MAVVSSPGDGVLELMQKADRRVVIAAPYIKSTSLCHLIQAIPINNLECICITRWLPEDIASGVCDIQIFEDIERVRGGKLLLHPHLHAKYYSNGHQSLVGSANLTARGLNWHTPPNVELLVEVPANFPGLVEWERVLVQSAIEVTRQLRDQILEEAKELKDADSMYHIPEVEYENQIDVESAYWVPKCPVPERLWDVYRGLGGDDMVSSAFKAARKDLVALSPPSGLNFELFTVYLVGILKQMPLFVDIDKLSLSGLTDRAAHEFLANRLEETSGVNDYELIWRIVKIWMVYFFPDTYRLETGQDVLVKGKKLQH